jgi:hypothetical protein
MQGLFYEIPPAVYAQFPEHYQGINLALWILYMVELVIGGFVLVSKTKKHDAQTAKRIEMGYAYLLFGYAIARIFFILAIAYDPDNYDFYCSCAYFFGSIGFASLISTLELTLKDKRSFFTLLALVGVVAGILGIIGFNRETVLLVVMGTNAMNFVLIFLLYGKIIYTSTGDLRKLAFFALLGVLIFGIASFIDGQYVLANPNIPKFVKEIIAPLMAMIAFGFILYGRKQI